MVLVSQRGSHKQKGQKMAHKIMARQSVSAASVTEIPAEVAEEIEGLFAHLTEHPDQEGYGEFDTAEERLTFVKQAKAYCEGREAGILKFRQLPSKNLPATVLRFSLKRDLEANAGAQSQAQITAGAMAR
jgi:hypothetical protein